MLAISKLSKRFKSKRILKESGVDIDGSIESPSVSSPSERIARLGEIMIEGDGVFPSGELPSGKETPQNLSPGGEIPNH